jgi:acetylornithine deacetylase/succinyl-diaminopimelate desuccinylase-like protein
MSQDSTPLAAALARLEATLDNHLDDLAALVRIGGVSAEPPPNPTLQASARAVVDLMARAGLHNARVLELEGAHPYAYAEWLGAPGAPTLLLYGHHDVQPVGRLSKWVSPPFEPATRDGRMYGRGAVDDKAGVMMHVAACAAWLDATGALPVNVKFIVEGEEEVGSGNLERFLETHAQLLSADCIVLTDTANLDAGIPSLTASLRGLAAITVDVRALRQPLHSGMWGGPLPDPVIALSRALGELVDSDGQVLASLRVGVAELTPEERSALEGLPFDEADFRAQAGLVPGAELIGRQDVPLYARLWREPAVTVIAFESRAIEGSSNQIIDSARARVSVRVVANQDPRAVQDALVAHFEARVPFGLEVSIERDETASPWMAPAVGPAFDAARRAMSAGYGRDCEIIGCGGTIPFVGPFAKVLGGVPALLTGVEDPLCHAHSENESLLIDDWKKGTRAAVHLYAELGQALTSR